MEPLDGLVFRTRVGQPETFGMFLVCGRLGAAFRGSSTAGTPERDCIAKNKIVMAQVAAVRRENIFKVS